MLQPKVSILVPIYNVEKYLSKCLDSLVNQTLKELEIICINDGSTDASLEIVKKYAENDQRIKIIDKKNSGYGDSMNRGLGKATGKYVGVLESDDFLDKKAFETLYALGEKYEAEVIRANYYHFIGGKNFKQEVVTPFVGRLVNPRKEYSVFYMPPAIWSGIYNRKFLLKNNIRFLATPGASYQDTGFSFKVWANATRVVFSDKAFLHYRLDNESSSVNNPGKVFCVCDEYAEIERYLREKEMWDELSNVMQRAKFGAYIWNIERLSPKLAKKFIRKMGEEYRSMELDSTYFTKKQRLMIKLITSCPPSVYYTFYQIRNRYPRK